MRILIVSPYYWPEDFSAGVYVRELAESLAQFGHQVTVLTAFPNYPEGRVHAGYRGKLFQVEHKDGVRIVRCFVYAVERRRNFLLRGLGYLSFSLTAFAGALYVGKIDVVYVVSPPPSLVSAAWFASRLHRARLVVGAKDLLSAWAQQKKEGGLGNRVVRLAARLEPSVFGLADHMQVASPAHARVLQQLGIPDRKITFIPDWADADAIHPMPRENAFRASQGLGGKFVVLYSGSMGHSSELETVLEAAKLLEDVPDIAFVLVGDGVKRPALEARAATLGLKNVRFLPLQPRDVFPQVLASADVCLITLNRASTFISGQGKMYSIMAAARPILAVMEREALGADVIVDEKMGEVVPPGDAVATADLLRRWHDAPQLLAEYGPRAREVLLRRFSLQVCARNVEALFTRVLNGHGGKT